MNSFSNRHFQDPFYSGWMINSIWIYYWIINKDNLWAKLMKTKAHTPFPTPYKMFENRNCGRPICWNTFISKGISRQNMNLDECNVLIHSSSLQHGRKIISLYTWRRCSATYDQAQYAAHTSVSKNFIPTTRGDYRPNNTSHTGSNKARTAE